MDKLNPCPFCGGAPHPRPVGDQKEYVVYFCSECGKTPVKNHEARLTLFGAKKTWNRRANND